jgi:CheY-like chemotaxis protein
VTTKARRVLIVDDNEIAAVMLREVLAGFGHTLEVALDGSAALELSREFQPEVVVLDVGLPLIDGCEVAQRLRKGPHGPRLKLFALSGYGRPQDTARAMAAGFDLYFVKPVDVEALALAIAG